MPADTPFIPVTGSVAGKSVVLIPVSTSGGGANAVIDSTGGYASSMLVTNTNQGVTLFVRMSTEAVPVATSLDVPIPPLTSRLFENPVPTGKSGVAVSGSVFGIVSSIFANNTGAVVFTPGNAGVE